MSDDIVARIRFYANLSIHYGWATVFRSDLNKFADEIERLRVERDDARREICIRSAGAERWMKTPKKVAHWSEEDVALSRGWDCFKEVNP